MRVLSLDQFARLCAVGEAFGKARAESRLSAAHKQAVHDLNDLCRHLGVDVHFFVHFFT